MAKTAEARLLIPDSLPLAVAFDGVRIRLAAAPRTLGISGPPFLGAVPAYLVVLGIGGNLLAVIIGAAPLLAPRFAAGALPRLKFGWLKNPITIPTPPMDHTGVVALNGIRRRPKICDAAPAEDRVYE